VNVYDIGDRASVSGASDPLPEADAQRLVELQADVNHAEAAYERAAAAMTPAARVALRIARMASPASSEGGAVYRPSGQQSADDQLAAAFEAALADLQRAERALECFRAECGLVESR
jgi:hypothetical protein